MKDELFQELTESIQKRYLLRHDFLIGDWRQTSRQPHCRIGLRATTSILAHICNK